MDPIGVVAGVGAIGNLFGGGGSNSAEFQKALVEAGAAVGGMIVFQGIMEAPEDDAEFLPLDV